MNFMVLREQFVTTYTSISKCKNIFYYNLFISLQYILYIYLMYITYLYLYSYFFHVTEVSSEAIACLVQ